MALFGVASGLAAQEDVTVKPGDRVRIRSVQVPLSARPVERTTVGQLQSMTPDSVVVLEADGRTTRLSLLRVHRFEVSRGTQTRLGDGLLLGAVAAGVLATSSVWVYEGLAACLETFLSKQCPERRPRRYGRIAAVGALAGAFLGGLIGRTMTTDRWERVTTGIGPGRSGSMGISVSVSF